MMYSPVEKFPCYPTIEKKILQFWEKTKAFDLLRAKNKGGRKWSFLDGPITANNPMGVHHAWGRSLKDMFQRYHAMCGQEQRFQNGFDCQGLWVEVEVEKELGFTSKKDIEEYGMARFVEECKKRVEKFSRIQTEQSIRLGYWMDWGNSYFTMTDQNNYTIWRFLKNCHDRGFLYKGFDSMPWCPRCGVGLSQMEMHEGYELVEDLSVFLRLPIKGRDKEALLVWTTTPWTLTSNVAAAVRPAMQYLKLKQAEWTYYVGAENWADDRRLEVEEETAGGKKRRVIRLQTIAQHLKRHGEVEVIGSLTGQDLLGLEYEGPYDHLPAQQERGGYPYPNPGLMHETGISCHRVIAWENVTGSEGTGIVHIATGCGREDFELGKQLGLVAISPLNESGDFLEKFGWLSGKNAHDVAEQVIEDLKRRGVLLAHERYPHRYAHCWRCSTAILYRLVDEWFISMEWREEIMKTVPKVRWIPPYGEQREMDWLTNMGDWMISKKRYWGLALPIWQCDRHSDADEKTRCGWFTVVGGNKELKEKAIAGWEAFEGNSPHRPWVDAVKIRCEQCGATASRISDVGTPWLDAGIVPYSTMGYNEERENWAQWFPPELVLECFPGQFRNWFYALLAMNTMMQQDRWSDRTGGESQVVPPFKTLLGHALVRDENGKEMHKSLGNAIEFNEAAETIGAEVMRYIFACQNPTINLNFPDISPGRRKDLVHLDQEVMRKLARFWNCYSFYVTYASVDGITPDMLRVPVGQRAELDRWIISKYQHLIAFARECFEHYRVHLLMERFERFLDDLSNWYVRRSRRRFWKSENDEDKLAAFATLFDVLFGLTRLLAPILPFLTEEIYQNLVVSVDPGAPVSVHLQPYPEVDPALIDASLEVRIDTVVRYKNLGLSLRNQKGLKVRQPLGRMLVKPETDEERAVLETATLRSQILEEVNVKRLEILESVGEIVKTQVHPNFKTLGQRYGKSLAGIKSYLAGADADVILAALERTGRFSFTLESGEVIVTAEDIEVRHESSDQFSFVFDNGAFAALEITITPDLKRESLARDFVRVVQIHRKDQDLHVADRIRLRYKAGREIAQAIEQWSQYICQETLAVELAPDDALTGETGSTLKVSGSQVVVSMHVADKR